ncbi:sirohydrochlorin chelatase [Actinokineospora fastidiosa]|uniref:Cobalamin biosynthesis protein n=1 Tax=Actinokineospora fastidiosa TaxID=1816 RepID=A0A918GJ03_9PSEU|nr:sirohydrochlorin chelatase [Actinokineospora fastidiosa]GGS41580.1 cobalamin biosynthesis protein [Actinokineospora fastidiosa]
MIPLVAVAHGSRDPRSAATVADLLDVVRERAPGLDVRGAFLDLSAPRLIDVLGALADEGHHRVVVAPLLLGRAFHARVDLPALLAEAAEAHPGLAVSVADVLGPSALLEAAALRRLADAGVEPGDPGLGVVLAAIGSSHAPANARVAEVARRWARTHGWAGVAPAFASATTPDVPTAIARLRARGARRIAVASWFLAPGLLPDKVAAQARAVDPSARIAPPMGNAVEVADLVVERYTAAWEFARTA